MLNIDEVMFVLDWLLNDSLFLVAGLDILVISTFPFEKRKEVCA